MPIQRSVLSNLESNRRTTITIAEILVLAAALQVPPGVLIFPAGYFNYAEVTPGRSVPAQAAVGWLAGTIRFGNEDPAFYHSHPFFKVRRHDEYAQQLDAYLEETVEAQRGYVEAALRIKEIDMARSALIDKHDNLTRGAILEAGIGQREYSSYQEYASPHYDQPSDEAPYPYYGAVEYTSLSDESAKQLRSIEEEIGNLEREKLSLEYASYRLRDLTKKCADTASLLWDLQRELKEGSFVIPSVTHRVDRYLGEFRSLRSTETYPPPYTDDVDYE